MVYVFYNYIVNCREFSLHIDLFCNTIPRKSLLSCIISTNSIYSCGCIIFMEAGELFVTDILVCLNGTLRVFRTHNFFWQIFHARKHRHLFILYIPYQVYYTRVSILKTVLFENHNIFFLAHCALWMLYILVILSFSLCLWKLDIICRHFYSREMRYLSSVHSQCNALLHWFTFINSQHVVSLNY